MHVIIWSLLLIATLNSLYEPDWNKYTSIVGNFVVLIPGTPIKDQKITTFDGHQIDFYRFYFTDSKSTSYLVGYLDFPEEKFETIIPENQLNTAGDRLIQ